MDLTNEALLKYAIENGIIDISNIQEEMVKKENEKYLKEHPYSIWEGKNGFWYTRLPDENKKNKLCKRKTKGEIEQLIISHYKQKENEPTVKILFEEWSLKKLLLKEISDSTYDRYCQDYNRFFRNKDIESKKVKFLTEHYLEDFIRTTIAELDLTSKGYSNLRTILRGMMLYAKKKGYSDISPKIFFGDLEFSRNTFRRRIRCKEKEVFSEGEIEVISSYLNDNPNICNLGIILSFQTGVRIGELCAIKKTDIQQSQLHIQRTETRYIDKTTGKQQRFIKEYPKSASGDRYIVLTEGAKVTINHILELNPDGVFLFEKRGKRILGKSFDYYIRKACNACNIIVKSMHKIRKTYGTTLIDGDVDESLIVSQMGHSDIKCTKQYYYYSNKDFLRNKQQLEETMIM